MLSLDLLATAVIAFYVSSAQAETTNQWATFPSAAKAASINGFADNIYDSLPECAGPCVEAGTGSTSCPYWYIDCLCVVSNRGRPVAECIDENCNDDKADSATSLALSICSSAGVPSPYWFIPALLFILSYIKQLLMKLLSPQPYLNILLMPKLPVTMLLLSHKHQRLLLMKLVAPFQHNLLLQKRLLLLSSAISDFPEVQVQISATAFNFPGNILVFVCYFFCCLLL